MIISKAVVEKAISMVNQAIKISSFINPDAWIAQYWNLLPSEHRTYFYSFLSGYIDHPAFEKEACWHYALREKMSASKAILSLLESGQILADSGITSNLISYLTILLKMQEIYGEEQGNQRFDCFFGEENKTTPKHRRLSLSRDLLNHIEYQTFEPNSETADIGRFPKGLLSVKDILSPISMLKKKIKVENVDTLNDDALIGANIVFHGHSRFKYKHPVGEAAYCCSILSTSPLTVATSQFPDKVLTKEALYEEHKNQFNDYPKLCSVALYDQCDSEETRLEKRNLKSSTKTYPKKIKGFDQEIIAWDQNRLTEILQSDIKKALDAFENYFRLDKITKTCKAELSCDELDINHSYTGLFILSNMIRSMQLAPSALKTRKANDLSCNHSAPMVFGRKPA